MVVLKIVIVFDANLQTDQKGIVWFSKEETE